jgi:hypothetical protein
VDAERSKLQASLIAIKAELEEERRRTEEQGAAAELKLADALASQQVVAAR